MASRTWWVWVWINSRNWWWTGKPGVLQSMGLQRVGHDWVTELTVLPTYSPKKDKIHVQEFMVTIGGFTLVGPLGLMFMLGPISSRWGWMCYSTFLGPELTQSWAIPFFMEAHGTPMGIWNSWEGEKGKMMKKLPTRVQCLPRSWDPKTIISTIKHK